MLAFISDPQAARLRKAVKPYKSQVKLGKPWNKRTEDALWRKVLGQVVVIGRAEPGELLQRSRKVGRRVSIKRLKTFRSDAELQKYLHEFLLSIGARYVSKRGGWKKDRKAAAAAQNFRKLMKDGGPKRFFEQVASCKTEKEKIEILQGALKQYGNKGARDTLIDLRLATNCMALDTRIFGVLKKVGVRVGPDDIYIQVERELREKVAEPLGIQAALLDRILFRKYDDILKQL
jgi:hypothetical protein